VKLQSNIANIEYIWYKKNHNKDSQCHRNRPRLLTNHTLHYDYRRLPCRAMVRNVWTQGTMAWYVTSAHHVM